LLSSCLPGYGFNLENKLLNALTLFKNSLPVFKALSKATDEFSIGLGRCAWPSFVQVCTNHPGRDLEAVVNGVLVIGSSKGQVRNEDMTCDKTET